MAVTLAAGALTFVAATEPAMADTPPIAWSAVATVADTIPGTNVAFNSFNAPAVNSTGQVVFRARSKGGSDSEPLHGVWTRSMGSAGSDIRTIATTSTPVPLTNSGATFTEFPSSPRIDQSGTAVVTRGQSTPTFTYVVGADPISQEPITTKAGTSGVYLNSGGTLVAGANLLGTVPTDQLAQASEFAVPGADSPTPIRFDQFPGSPSVTGTTVVFKGNYTDATGAATGVFYRDTLGGPTHLIANSKTLMPGQPAGGARFGSTAPPSASGTRAVFVGWDNESAPSVGGVYLASLVGAPAPLTPLAEIGDQVPGSPAGTTFNNFGESLSFDGRYVAFWASWGTEIASTTGVCPNDGNKDRLAYCLAHDNNATLTYPVHQGIFVHDTVTGETTPAARTGDVNGYSNLLFWGYSGHVPGTGDSEDQSQEPPAWRASSYIALSGDSRGYQVAFEASNRTGDKGIYLVSPARGVTAPTTLLDTRTSGRQVDPRAPGQVTALSLERDGFRDGWLAVAVSTFDTVTGASWAGVYNTRVPMPIATRITAPEPEALYAVGSPVTLTAAFTDTATSAKHTCAIDWGSGIHTIGSVSESNGAGTCTATGSYPSSGIYTVTARVTDSDNGMGSADVPVVIYDPSGGFVTGGGWITSPAGAFAPRPSVTGRATFGFVSKYQKGATQPSGATQFAFETAGLSFVSTGYDWLVVSGPLAQYKGVGTVSGLGSPLDGTYKFMLTAQDGALRPPGGPDTFRIRLFRDDAVLYDNGAHDVLGGGSIVIHRN